MDMHDVKAHCYFFNIGQTDREQIHSRINNNDGRTFRPRRPLSTAYKTIVIDSALYLLTISLPDMDMHVVQYNNLNDDESNS